MRIEAPNLQEAFQKAADELGCSITHIDIKIIQHPSNGFFGFFKKSAIIEAVRENDGGNGEEKAKFKDKDRNKHDKQKRNHDVNSEAKKTKEEQNLATHKTEEKHVKHDEKKKNKHKKHRDHHEKSEKHETPKPSVSEQSSALAQAAFLDKENEEDQVEFQIVKPEYTIKRMDTQTEKEPTKNILDTSILDNFNQISTDGETDKNNEHMAQKTAKKEKKEPIDFDKILPQIQEGLENLFKASCFAIDKIKVAKFSDECVLIELDGQDAALLIGKEGYRYKAISYLLYSWLNLKFNLTIRLEIAQFLQNQEAAIEQYLEGIIERVQNTGKAQTKPLDGVLVKIALEKLRERFPDKYVGIKSGNEGKFVIVNEFFKK